MTDIIINNEEHDVNALIADFEKVYAKEMTGYADLIASGKLCSLQSYKRILKEVRDINADFHTLRTCVSPVEDVVGILHFIMTPSDGAMAEKQLCGRILIPNSYPIDPPIVHLFTRTNRFNVDAYNVYVNNMHILHSSMCFDILKAEAHGGIWKPQYCLSALISSLLQSIVSVTVPQEYGEDKEEFVSMETLSSIHQNVDYTYNEYKKYMPQEKPVKKIEAIAVKAKSFEFPNVIIANTDQRDKIVSSNPIYLQRENKADNVYCCEFDLSDLSNNRSTVFSIVLSNDRTDMTGRKATTILIRNGVTATAAKKKLNGRTKWFYHGKPMNQNDLKLIVTVGYDQFTISYVDSDGKNIVHGDCAVSFLTEAEIGNVKNMPFFLNIFLKNKKGKPVTIKTKSSETGYLHPRDIANIVAPEAQKQIVEKSPVYISLGLKLPVYISLGLDGLDTEELKNKIIEKLVEHKIDHAKYKIKRGIKDLAHLTLAFNSDFDSIEEYAEFIETNYSSNKDTIFSIKITGFAVDNNCVACMVKLNNVKFYPSNKILHLTMMLNGKPPVYSNQLLKTLLDPNYKLKPDEKVIMFDSPIVMNSVIEFNGQINKLMKKK